MYNIQNYTAKDINTVICCKLHVQTMHTRTNTIMCTCHPTLSGSRWLILLDKIDSKPPGLHVSVALAMYTFRALFEERFHSIIIKHL